MTVHITQAAEGLGRLAFTNADLERLVEVGILDHKDRVDDLRRKPLVYAAFGVRELWVIDAARRTVHRHDDVGPDGYATITQCGPGETMMPGHAPGAFAFALDGLDDL